MARTRPAGADQRRRASGNKTGDAESPTVGHGSDSADRRVSRRAGYAEAGSAFRAFHERLLGAADDLRPVDWRVGMAVANLTMSWSRTGDHVDRNEVADLAGCVPQVAGKSLARLSRLGVLVWEPSRANRGARADKSWLSIAVEHETAAVSCDQSAKPSMRPNRSHPHETAAVSPVVPRSGSEEKTPESPNPRDVEADRLCRVLGEHWPGPISRTRHVEPLVVLLRTDLPGKAGWMIDQVIDLVTARTSGADQPWSMEPLMMRLGRVQHLPSYAKAQEDKTLLGYLGRLPEATGRGGRRASAATMYAGTSEEHGPTRVLCSACWDGDPGETCTCRPSEQRPPAEPRDLAVYQEHDRTQAGHDRLSEQVDPFDVNEEPIWGAADR